MESSFNAAAEAFCVSIHQWNKSGLNTMNTLRLTFAGLVLLGIYQHVAPPAAGDQPTSFRRDVMPVLFRANYNAGTCHGAARGKDGFHLSLFGYDPQGDYFRIAQEMIGRRVDIAAPENSLLLLKSVGAVPHTGGKLFEVDSPYYQSLRAWIAQGAKDDATEIAETVGLELSADRFLFEQVGSHDSLRVTAIASDGTRRDVTDLTRFHSNNPSVVGDSHVFARFSRFTVGAEVIVLPPVDGFSWPDPPANNYIDKIVFDRLQKLRIVPSELCDEETFLRRITIDLAGRVPTADEYRQFIRDDRPDKRSQKIDELLHDDTFADLWTTLWAEQLRVMGGNYAPVGTHIKAADAYYEWIRTQMRNDRPLNEFVSDMVSASGSNLINGPANLYTMLVHAPRFDPKAFAADFSQVFLGVQIQCAECHNHPFDRWTMDDYYSLVSFFTGVRRKPGVESREQRIYYDPSAQPAKHLVDQRPMPAKAIGEVEPANHQGDPRRELARWLTATDNELFSRNLANRIWAQLLGRGVVEPVDDVRVSNPPVNGPLLDALADRLVQSNFSLRTLVRDICHSRVYQLGARPNESNRLDQRQFSHAKLRRLRADVLIDSVVTVTGVPRGFSGFPDGTRAIDVYPRTAGDTAGPKFGDIFFETFGRSSRNTICVCETKLEPTLSQTLHMAVGDTLRSRLGAGGQIKQLLADGKSAGEMVESLFVMALCRKPTEQEKSSLTVVIGDFSADAGVYEDILWGLINSTEFLFNH